jgi:NCS1 family nucleobase:cation symporter-1
MGGLLESRSIDYIPLAERHGKVWHLWPVWFAGNAQLATLATGTVGASQGLGVLWSAVAVVLGCGFGTFFMAFHAAQGPALGLPQMIQSRPQFGSRGALLVYAVALLTYLGFIMLNLLLLGESLPLLTRAPVLPALLAVTVLACLLAAAGYRAIHWAQRAVSAAVLLVLVLFSVLCVRLPVAPAMLNTHFMVLPFLAQFFAAASYQLSWAIYVSDYSRYLPRETGIAASFWWTYFGSLIGGAWMMLAGLAAYAVYPKLDLPPALVGAGDAVLPGLGPILLATGMLGLVSATSVNLYGATLTWQSLLHGFWPRAIWRFWRLVTMGVVAALGLALSLLPHGRVIDEMSDVLFVMLYLFTPWTAINLVDFYLLRRGHYSAVEIFRLDGMYGRWNWRGLVAYALGFAVMVPFFSTGLYEGAVAKALGGADLSMLIGLPVAAGAYIFFNRHLDAASEARRALAADAQLDAA